MGRLRLGPASTPALWFIFLQVQWRCDMTDEVEVLDNGLPDVVDDGSGGSADEV